MFDRFRQENPRLFTEIFVERLYTAKLREARARLAMRLSGPYQKLSVLQSCVGLALPCFRMRTLPFSKEDCHLLARLVLGELPVDRIKANF